MLPQHLGTTPLGELQQTIAGTSFLLLFLFVLFYTGQILHSNLLEMADKVFEAEWYRYPCIVQRCLLLMAMQTQRPFFISAYGILKFNLENFLRVNSSLFCFFEYEAVRNVFFPFHRFLNQSTRLLCSCRVLNEYEGHSIVHNCS